MTPAPRDPAVILPPIALIPEAAEALDRLTARTGLSVTDAVNRALQLYGFAEAQLADGAELLVRKDGAQHAVRML